MARICSKCKSTMHLVSKYSSGNANFQTWQCDECMNKDNFCAGLE